MTTLAELNKHLFAQLDRLGKSDISEADLQQEVKRTDSMVRLGATIVDNANTALKAAEIAAEYSGQKADIPKMIGNLTE